MTNHKFWGIIKFHDHWCPPSLGHVTDGRTLIMLAPHMSIKVIVTIKIMSHTSQLNSSSSCRWLMWAWNVLSRYNYLLHYRGHRQQNKLFNCDMYEQHFDNSDNLNDHIRSKHDQCLYKLWMWIQSNPRKWGLAGTRHAGKSKATRLQHTGYQVPSSRKLLPVAMWCSW